MNESIYGYMRLGIIHFMAFPQVSGGEGPVLETIKRIARDDYFNAVEITHIKDRETRKQVSGILKTAHMDVAYGAQPLLLAAGLNLNDTREEKRKEAVSFLKRMMDEACEMGAEGFAFLSGKYDEERKEEAFSALLESTRELCSYARTKGGIKVIHEVFDFDIDKKSLVGPACLAGRYAREIREEFDNFGLMVDLSHLPLLRETAEESIMPVKEYIVHAHMGNCVVKDPALPGYGDLHPRFGFPGGENDVDELAGYLRVLLENGFLNKENPPMVSFEVRPFGEEDPELVIANAKRVLNMAWARL